MRDIMPTAANPQPYPNPAWQNAGGQSPWGRPSGGRPWGASPWTNQYGATQNWGPAFWHPVGIGRPIAIAAVVFLLAAGHIGRMLFWPVAVAGLVFMVATGRIGCHRRRWGGNWGQQEGQPGDGPNGSGGNGWMPPWANWCGGGNRASIPPSSGNHAFDEYRAETLRRLEEEQNEFSSFLERLRFAKDKAEFDQFMAERRQTPTPPTVPPTDEPSRG
jgi:hypothetical protein